MISFRLPLVIAACVVALMPLAIAAAQQASVRPGINDSFRNPDPQAFVERFETESREVYAEREAIVAAMHLTKGQAVADVGAGTGLFTRLFAEKVGPTGTVYAVDIAPKFLDHIAATSEKSGLSNVKTVLATDETSGLPPNSVDAVFVCDTYHHFEYPLKTMASIGRALKPGGEVFLIDFRRIEGESSDWTLEHVRAGQEVFESEIVQAGFRKTAEIENLLEENYFVVFQKSTEAKAGAPLHPIVEGFGAVRPRASDVEAPRPGAKVIFDVTAETKEGAPNKGLDRAAKLLNLYGLGGAKASDVSIAIVLHGGATRSALSDDATKTLELGESNPDLKLIEKLRAAGVEILVCGQSLAEKGFAPDDVSPDVVIAFSAMTTVINRQADGYSYIPVP